MSFWQRTARAVSKSVSDSKMPQLLSVRVAYSPMPTPVVLMKGAEGPIRTPITMFAFNTLDDINQFGKGSDADIGGLSTANLTLEEQPEINQPIGKEATGVFWGDMRLKVKPGMEGRIRGGYAGIKSKVWFFSIPYAISHVPLLNFF